MYQIIKEKYKDYMVFLLVGLFAYCLGDGLFKFLAEPSLGSLIKNNVKAIVVLCVLFFLHQEFTFVLPNIKTVPKVHILTTVFLGLLFAILVINYGIMDLTYIGIILFILGSLCLSIFYILTERSFNAFCLFWVAYPFVCFINKELGSIGFKNIFIYDLAVSIESIYLLIIFVVYFLKNISKMQIFFNKQLVWFYLLMLLPIPFLCFSDNVAKSFVFYIFDMLIPILFCIFTLTSIKDKKQIEKGISFLLISLGLFLFVTFYFYLRMNIQENSLDLYGSSSIVIISFGNLAGLVFFVLPFILFKMKENKGYVVLFLIAILFILLSNSRSVQLGLIMCFGLILVFSRIKLNKKILCFILMLGSFLFIFFGFHCFGEKLNYSNRLVLSVKEYFKNEINIDKLSSGRIEILDSAIRMIKDHPIKGIGAGMWNDYAFLYRSKEYYVKHDGAGHNFYYSIDSHNFFLDLYLKYGIFTFLFFLFFLFFILNKSFHLYKNMTASKDKQILISCFICLSCFFVVSNFGFRFYFYQCGSLISGVFFFAIIAFAFKLIQKKV